MSNIRLQVNSQTLHQPMQSNSSLNSSRCSYVDLLLRVALLERPEQCRLDQLGQLAHIVHILQRVLIVRQYLVLLKVFRLHREHSERESEWNSRVDTSPFIAAVTFCSFLSTRSATAHPSIEWGAQIRSLYILLQGIAGYPGRTA